MLQCTLFSELKIECTLVPGNKRISGLLFSSYRQFREWCSRHATPSLWTSHVQFHGEDGTEAIRAHVGVDVLKGGLCALVGNLDTLLYAIVVIDPSQSKVSFLHHQQSFSLLTVAQT